MSVFQFHSVTPVSIFSVPKGAVMVASNGPGSLDGVSRLSNADLDVLAACALNAGHDVWIASFRDSTRYDLFVR